MEHPLRRPGTHTRDAHSALEKIWSRWLAIAGAVAVLPWAVVLTFGLPEGVPLMQQTVALALGLSLFVVLYRYSIEWHVAIPAVLLLGLVIGVLLLATQKTIGLLLVMVSCMLFVPAGAYFVWKEAGHTGEVYLFAASFLPGVVAGWA